MSKSKENASAEICQSVAQSHAVVSLIVMREFQHRVANTLAVLNSSLRLELKTFNVPGLEEALRHHEKQVAATVDLYRFFSRYSEDVEIPANHYFESLCAVLSNSVLAPLGLHCEASIHKKPMRAEECELLGMAIAELVLNAAKHAFSSNILGCVRIELFERERRWCCIVFDNGIGIRNTSPESGSQIVQNLVDALKGQIAIRSGPDGTAVSITFIGQEGQPRI